MRIFILILHWDTQKIATGGRLDFFLDLGQSFTKDLFESISYLRTVLCTLCNPYNAR